MRENGVNIFLGKRKANAIVAPGFLVCSPTRTSPLRPGPLIRMLTNGWKDVHPPNRCAISWKSLGSFNSGFNLRRVKFACLSLINTGRHQSSYQGSLKPEGTPSRQQPFFFIALDSPTPSSSLFPPNFNPLKGL